MEILCLPGPEGAAPDLAGRQVGVKILAEGGNSI
jgi:hypothetical protein